MAPQPAFANRPRLQRRVEKALRAGGLHIATQAIKDALVDLLVQEETQSRARAAEMIVTTADRYGTIDETMAKRLAHAVEVCVVDDNNQIFMPEEE